MKFTLSLLAALLGVVSASGHNGSANGTVTTVVSGGGDGGGATTPTPTSGGDSANQTSFSVELTLTVTLPGNVTSTAVSAVGTAATEYTNHIGANACSTETAEANKYVCFSLAVLNQFYVGKDADKAVMYGKPTAADARRRSLDETTARRLTSADIKYPLKLYVDSSKEAALKTSANTAPTGAQLETAANAIASSMPADFATAVADLKTATATVAVVDDATTTAAATTSTSSAFKMGASALAVVFSVVSLF
jgi:hypothetical protein